MAGMSDQAALSMSDWLASTRFCDWAHPAIREAAYEASRGASSDRAAAIQLFRFVRDRVLYMFGPWGLPASATLARRAGTCTNKNNLFVALARAVGIPAGYGVLHVNGKEYFGNIAPGVFKPFLSAQAVHVYAAVQLGDRWVKCDTSTDREIADRTAHFCPQTRLVEWDGAVDALDALDPDHVYTDLGVRPSVDDLLGKPARNSSPAVLAQFNDYLRFVRAQPPYPSAEGLIGAYLSQRARAAMPEP
jgi:transglutaminase-like putative cysteine protease